MKFQHLFAIASILAVACASAGAQTLPSIITQTVDKARVVPHLVHSEYLPIGSVASIFGSATGTQNLINGDGRAEARAELSNYLDIGPWETAGLRMTSRATVNRSFGFVTTTYQHRFNDDNGNVLWSSSAPGGNFTLPPTLDPTSTLGTNTLGAPVGVGPFVVHLYVSRDACGSMAMGTTTTTAPHGVNATGTMGATSQVIVGGGIGFPGFASMGIESVIQLGNPTGYFGIRPRFNQVQGTMALGTTAVRMELLVFLSLLEAWGGYRYETTIWDAQSPSTFAYLVLD